MLLFARLMMFKQRVQRRLGRAVRRAAAKSSRGEHWHRLQSHHSERSSVAARHVRNDAAAGAGAERFVQRTDAHRLRSERVDGLVRRRVPYCRAGGWRARVRVARLVTRESTRVRIVEGKIAQHPVSLTETGC